jgi:hypothetical protein
VGVSRKLLWCALALAAACGKDVVPGPGPLDHLRLPTGLAVHHGKVLAVSSNSDLFYDELQGGTVITLDPITVDSVRVPAGGAIRVRSFGSDLALARSESWGGGVPDAEACGTAVPVDLGALAVFGTRGSNTLNVLGVADDGSLRCERCGIAAGTGFGDPVAVAIACGGGRSRAFSGYLTTSGGVGHVTELDLESGKVTPLSIGAGPVRGFAYDRDRDRLFMAGLATGSPTPLRWVDLAGCTFGLAPGAGGCTIGSALLGTPASGLELRSLALANSATPGVARPAGAPIRAYATGRLYDLGSAATAGGRTTDYGGLIIVLDLVQDALGGVTPQVAWTEPTRIGRGAQEIRVLPRCTDPVCDPSWSAVGPTRRRDVVAALSVDEGELTIYDDETHSVAVFRTNDLTGAPFLGHQPYGLAVDPEVVGTRARVWVGSYGDGFLTPIEVPLDAPDRAAYEGGTQHRISGATP